MVFAVIEEHWLLVVQHREVKIVCVRQTRTPTPPGTFSPRGGFIFRGKTTPLPLRTPRGVIFHLKI